MAIRDIFSITRKTFFNPAGWIDANLIKTQTLNTWDILKITFTPAKATQTETFEEACERLQISETQLQELIKTYHFYVLLFLACAGITLLYTFYLMFTHFTFTGLLLGIASTALFAAQAFRYDFWVLQMRSRRLGITFAEWKEVRLGGKHV